MEGFLKSIGLAHLIHIFLTQEITLDILPELGHDDLKEIGINAFGHRHIIIKGLSKSCPVPEISPQQVEPIISSDPVVLIDDNTSAPPILPEGSGITP